ncbi:zinc finger A20 and AN1 domain-containing stress-associated protein 1-like [Silene latifolia]|uniref:zinc finger A20 and AN1 domain-containing stress-associated protein 1-like n=1 Tax=Silene latifolia TaxID=37657 RepID=UPI003D78A759
MAQNREKDETLELQVPAESPLSLSTPTGCGSIGPEPTRLDRKDACRPRSDPHTPGSPPTDERKRTATHQASTPDTAKRPVNRCSGCRKRVGLTGFRCRCGDLFCSDHRYSDRHDCSYDYKSAGREAIARENPVVRAAKILKV